MMSWSGQEQAFESSLMMPTALAQRNTPQTGKEYSRASENSIKCNETRKYQGDKSKAIRYQLSILAITCIWDGLPGHQHVAGRRFLIILHPPLKALLRCGLCGEAGKCQGC